MHLMVLGRVLTSTIRDIESWHQYNAQHPDEFKYGADDRAHSWPKGKGVSSFTILPSLVLFVSLLVEAAGMAGSQLD